MRHMVCLQAWHNKGEAVKVAHSCWLFPSCACWLLLPACGLQGAVETIIV